MELANFIATVSLGVIAIVFAGWQIWLSKKNEKEERAQKSFQEDWLKMNRSYRSIFLTEKMAKESIFFSEERMWRARKLFGIRFVYINENGKCFMS